MGINIKNLKKVLEAFTKNTGDRPYAFLCNKKTFKKIEREARLTLHDPDSFYKFESGIGCVSVLFGGIPVFKSEGCPDNKIYALDKRTTLKIRAHKLPWG